MKELNIKSLQNVNGLNDLELIADGLIVFNMMRGDLIVNFGKVSKILHIYKARSSGMYFALLEDVDNIQLKYAHLSNCNRLDRYISLELNLIESKVIYLHSLMKQLENSVNKRNEE